MRLFCAHDFVIEKQTHQKSEIEIMIDAGVTSVSGYTRPAAIFTIYKCRKCNKIRESVVIME